MITYRQLVDKSIQVERQLFDKKILHKPILGRYKHYQKTISLLRDHWEAKTMDRFWKDYDQGDMGFALKELHELTDIFEQLVYIYDDLSEDSKHFIKEKLPIILSGPNYTVDETPQNSSARNYQFELRLAAKIIAANYKNIAFAEHPDLLVIVDNRPYAFECKRVLGDPESKIPSNIETAIKQLEDNQTDKFGGIVAVDLSTQYEKGENWLSSSNRSSANKFALDELERVAWVIHNRMYKVKQAAKRGYLVGLILNLSTVYVLSENNEMGWIQETGILVLNKENPSKSPQFMTDFEDLQRYVMP